MESLSIDETTGRVELVPNSPTTETVYLGQAQGYNNAVKLLNDAYSNLYRNDSKGITARSINIGDIEKYMTDIALTEAHEYVNTASNTKYGEKVSSEYTGNKNYQAIYAQEKLAVIDDKTNENKGLDLSEQSTFVERTEGTNGIIPTGTSIQTYQTYRTMKTTEWYLTYR